MTKVELIRFLEPFMEETEIKIETSPSVHKDIVKPAYKPCRGDADAYVYLVVVDCS